MQRFSFLIFILLTFCKCTFSQTTDDVYYKSNSAKKDTTVSKFGIYVSGGLGGCFRSNIGGYAATFSFSGAYRSHLLTFTACGFSNTFTGIDNRGENLIGHINAIMLGEAFRSKNFMASISSGVSFTEVTYGVGDSNGRNLVTQLKTLIPLEIKLFYLSYNGAGVGLHYTTAFDQHMPQTITLSFVLGYWNKSKKHEKKSK